MISARMRIASGSCGAGFTTTVHPTASVGAILPGDVREREVVRRDARDRADGQPVHVRAHERAGRERRALHRRRRERDPDVLRRVTRVAGEALDRDRHLHARADGGGRAGLRDDQRHEVVLQLDELLGDRGEQRGRARPRASATTRGTPPARARGLLGLLHRRFGRLGHDLFRGRVHDRGGAGRAVDQLAADQQLPRPLGRRPSHSRPHVCPSGSESGQGYNLTRRQNQVPRPSPTTSGQHARRDHQGRHRRRRHRRTERPSPTSASGTGGSSPSARSTRTPRASPTPPGCIVAPGFVDPHTHYDAQLMWDPTASPSSMHGVTTVSAATAASASRPLRDGDADYLRQMMAKVEGMPLPALEQGTDWEWETFGQFLDRFEGNIAVNAGFLAGHCAIRRYVMGPDAIGNEATPEQIADDARRARRARSTPVRSGSRSRRRARTPTATAIRSPAAGPRPTSSSRCARRPARTRAPRSRASCRAASTRSPTTRSSCSARSAPRPTAR